VFVVLLVMVLDGIGAFKRSAPAWSGPGRKLPSVPADAFQAPLNVDELRRELAGPLGPWRALDVVASTASTNGDMLARAAAGDDIGGAVLIAEHQTAGRGRHGRRWVTPAGSHVTLSVGVRADQVPVDRWGWLPLATGVAVVDAVNMVAGIDAALKWPNDVLAGGGKLAGILTEVAARSPFVVVGLGLNVAVPVDDVPGGRAMSLAALGVGVPDRTVMVIGVLRELAARIGQWRGGGEASQQLARDYRARSLTIGTGVRAVLPSGSEIVGIARAVDDQGRLCIESNGETAAISAGDITHLRPVGGGASG
jgi:BirA family transcriptional regulator, biotin operon repressor / biotin---[acetyl-CoA-carboxylase] ligase